MPGIFSWQALFLEKLKGGPLQQREPPMNPPANFFVQNTVNQDFLLW